MAQVFEEQGFGTAAEFQKAAANATLIADLDPAARDLEGYLFPETYSLPRDTPASVVVEQMVAGFKNALTPEMRTAAESDGLTSASSSRSRRSLKRKPAPATSGRWSPPSIATG